MPKAKRQTNEQLLRSLMNSPRYGALSQMFIIDALLKHSEAVAEAGPAACESPLIPGHAWHGCAVEVRDAILQHLGEQMPAAPTATFKE